MNENQTRAMFYCKACEPNRPCDTHARGYARMRELQQGVSEDHGSWVLVNWFLTRVLAGGLAITGIIVFLALVRAR